MRILCVYASRGRARAAHQRALAQMDPIRVSHKNMSITTEHGTVYFTGQCAREKTLGRGYDQIWVDEAGKIDPKAWEGLKR